MGQPIKPGVKLYGYCGGHFGRDSYGTKLCVDSGYDSGTPWAVFREIDGYGDWQVIYGDSLDAVLDPNNLEEELGED